jgi:hypothetical protein
MPDVRASQGEGNTMPTVHVDIVKSRKRFPVKRPQMWTVRVSSENNRILLSSETYTNLHDAAECARLVMGVHTTARLYVDGTFVELLRMGAPQ